jgi:hypothetical protein
MSGSEMVTLMFCLPSLSVVSKISTFLSIEAPVGN